jgi:hypothetical protein
MRPPLNIQNLIKTAEIEVVLMAIVIAASVARHRRRRARRARGSLHRQPVA